MEDTITVTMNTGFKGKEKKSKSLWVHAFDSLKKNKMAMASLSIVVFYLFLAFLSFTGIIGGEWAKEVGYAYDSPFWVKWLSGEEAPFSMIHLLGQTFLEEVFFIR